MQNSLRTGAVGPILGFLVSLAAVWLLLVLIPAEVKKDLAGFLNLGRNGEAAANEGFLRGRLTIGKICFDDEENCQPPTGARANRLIRVQNAQTGEPVEILNTNTAGEFAATLPAGQYRLEMDLRQGERSPNLPGYVSVNSKEETRLTLEIIAE